MNNFFKKFEIKFQQYVLYSKKYQLRAISIIIVAILYIMILLYSFEIGSCTFWKMEAFRFKKPNY